MNPMTLIHYIGADKPLATGSFGYVYTYKKYSEIPLPTNKNDLRNIVDFSSLEDSYVKVFESNLDAAGLYIQEITSTEYKKRIRMAKPYIYVLEGSFEFNRELAEQCPEEYPEYYEISMKYIRLLISYIDEHLDDHESLEIYSCWSGEEELGNDPVLEKAIHLPFFSEGDSFRLVDKQLIRFTK